MLKDWTDPQTLNWDDVRELHAIKKLAQIIERRWHLTVGFGGPESVASGMSNGGDHAHVRSVGGGRQEAAATVVLEGERIGRVSAGTFAEGELEPRDLEYLVELMDLVV